jgi:hypothetical protein
LVVRTVTIVATKRVRDAVSHAFVDESRRGSRYIVCAAIVQPRELAGVRRALRSELLTGQNRLHFNTEKPSRRRKLLSIMATLPVTTMVFESKRKEPVARRWAIARLLHLNETGGQRLVIEARSSAMNVEERQRITVALARGKGPASLTYEHMHAREEPILWVPDAVAWAYGAGGDWGSRVAPAVVKDSA